MILFYYGVDVCTVYGVCEMVSGSDPAESRFVSSGGNCIHHNSRLIYVASYAVVSARYAINYFSGPVLRTTK